MKDITIPQDTVSAILDNMHALECSIEQRMLEEMKKAGDIVGLKAYIEDVDNWGRWMDAAEDMAIECVRQGTITDYQRLTVDLAADYLNDCDDDLSKVRSLQRQIIHAASKKPVF